MRYVRLFLRKTAAWHRIERLGYHSDVSDMEKAICALLQSRILPKANHENFDGFGDNIEATEGSEGQLLGDSFAFADGSDGSITTLEEAVSLLSLEEVKGLAKEAKVQGKNKADLSKALYRMSAQQTGLLSFGLQRRSSSESNVDTAADREDFTEAFDGSSNSRHLNRHAHFLSKILAITGPLIRLSEPVFKLFERVHLVFYRSTEWTEKSLTTIILAKMSRRNFPDYIVCRSRNIFLSRSQLLEFEDSLRKEAGVDKILEFNGPPGEEGFRKVLDIFGAISSRWRELLAEEQRREEEVYDSGEGAYLRRFNPAHAYTRIAHKAAYAHGRLHEHAEEHVLISELLAQRLFHPARRGYWYQRKALLEEHYMWGADDTSEPGDPERRKQHWRRIAAATCQAGLEDRDCHLIYHYDLQKRLVKLERRLRIPKRLQHDFGHVRLRRPEEHSVSGTQIKKHTGPDRPGAKTVWLDELGDGASEVSVEEMCLSWYRRQGWKGYHSEGGILRTLFAYLFFDVLFLYIPNVFQTAYQTCPLDLRTDAFFPTRASEINHRLVEIANGRAEGILRDVHQRESPRRTCVVGLNWDFDVEDLAELVRCFDGAALAAISKVMAQEYTARGGGVPDLVLWRPGTGGTTNKPGREEDRREEDQDQGITRQETCSQQERSGRTQADAPLPGEVLFAEVKSANDRLSDTQRLWIHVLTGAGVRVALCNAVAREIKFIG